MFVTIITDCIDSNAFGRQMTRAASLFGFPPVPVAITPEFDLPSDIEAGGHLIDMLDASRGRPGIILVNKAPRSGKAKKWANGTPFGYFWYDQTLVVSSVDGHALSLVKKLGLTQQIHVFDIPTVAQYAKANNLMDSYDADYLVTTQFRSFEFVPHVAKWVYDSHKIPSEIIDISEIPDCPPSVFFADNFGNLKTTVFPDEIGFEAGKVLNLQNFGPITCYERLKDLPNGEVGLIIGSSGLKGKRFLEIMSQGKSAKELFRVQIGSEVSLAIK
jgi:hypothetical protein